jgi:hypothetical protein
MKSNNKIDKGWNLIFKELNILESIKKNGFFDITSKAMNSIDTKVDARLLAKIDTRKHLPSIFKDNSLGILSISNGVYKIAKFDQFFDLNEKNVPVEKLEILLTKPKMELLNEDNITSESKAIDFVYDSDVLNLIFGDQFRLAKRDRERSLEINFKIDGIKFNVEGTQVEIDGCYEGVDNVLIIEGKSCDLNNLTLRQILYPYLSLKKQSSKKIIFTILTYNQKEFKLYTLNIDEKNRIKLVKIYKIEFKRDVPSVYAKFCFVENDLTCVDYPFPQANNFNTVINLFLSIYGSNTPIDKDDIYINSKFPYELRQLDYYLNTLAWLGVISVNNKLIHKTQLGFSLYKKSNQDRNIELAKIVFSNKICKKILLDEKITKSDIKLAQNKNLMSDSTFNRRKSSIKSWVCFFKKLLIIE